MRNGLQKTAVCMYRWSVSTSGSCNTRCTLNCCEVNCAQARLKFTSKKWCKMHSPIKTNSKFTFKRSYHNRWTRTSFRYLAFSRINANLVTALLIDWFIHSFIFLLFFKSDSRKYSKSKVSCQFRRALLMVLNLCEISLLKLFQTNIFCQMWKPSMTSRQSVNSGYGVAWLGRQECYIHWKPGRAIISSTIWAWQTMAKSFVRRAVREASYRGSFYTGSHTIQIRSDPFSWTAASHSTK